MKVFVSLLLGLLLLLVSADESFGFSKKYGISLDNDINALNRSSFPPGFIFGGATAAYQVRHASIMNKSNFSLLGFR